MWQQALEPGPSCLAIERFAETLTAAEAAHVAGCARCQTERELFAAYEANEPVEGEGLAVAWIASQTKRRETKQAWKSTCTIRRVEACTCTTTLRYPRTRCA